MQWWYQYDFATERGRLGYEKHRNAFAKLIWKLASPRWSFDDATFERSAASLGNPDHVAITIPYYRWRLALADGEARYDEFEKRLAAAPAIAVPTITMEGDANGAPHANPAAYASKFSGRYSHRTITGGVGHNLPQEAPQDFCASRDRGRRLVDTTAPSALSRGFRQTRSDLNPARSSEAKRYGSSHAAKWPPLSSRL